MSEQSSGHAGEQSRVADVCAADRLPSLCCHTHLERGSNMLQIESFVLIGLVFIGGNL